MKVRNCFGFGEVLQPCLSLLKKFPAREAKAEVEPEVGQ